MEAQEQCEDTIVATHNWLRKRSQYDVITRIIYHKVFLNMRHRGVEI